MSLQKFSSFFLFLFFSSCGTMMNGITQKVKVDSSPSYADLYVDGVFIGKTPIAVELARRDNHILQIQEEGYEPFCLHITKYASKWAYIDAALGPLTILFDAGSGGAFKLKPNHILCSMRAMPPAEVKGEEDTAISIINKKSSSHEP